jgi:hypothetical protein
MSGPSSGFSPPPASSRRADRRSSERETDTTRYPPPAHGLSAPLHGTARRKARSRASCVGADGDPIEVPADDAIERKQAAEAQVVASGGGVPTGSVKCTDRKPGTDEDAAGVGDRQPAPFDFCGT